VDIGPKVIRGTSLPHEAGVHGPNEYYNFSPQFINYYVQRKKSSKRPKPIITLTIKSSKTIYMYVGIYVEMRCKIKNVVRCPIMIDFLPTFTHQMTATNDPISRDYCSISTMESSRTADNMHPCESLRTSERGEPLNIHEWMIV
jgi:hypothetical protein